MIFDIILQAKKLIFLVLHWLKHFFGTQKLMTYIVNFSSERSWSVAGADTERRRSGARASKI